MRLAAHVSVKVSAVSRDDGLEAYTSAATASAAGNATTPTRETFENPKALGSARANRSMDRASATIAAPNASSAPRPSPGVSSVSAARYTAATRNVAPLLRVAQKPTRDFGTFRSGN